MNSCQPSIFSGRINPNREQFYEGLRDTNIVKIIHVRDDKFLVCYRYMIFDLVDLEEMRKAMEARKSADGKEEEKCAEKPLYRPEKSYAF